MKISQQKRKKHEQCNKCVTYVGIDYSLKSPAVCVMSETADDMRFFIFPREGSLKDKYIETLKEHGIIVTPVSYIKNVKDLAENERINSEDSENLATAVASAIQPYITDETFIGIEGISFASPGNTKIQYAGYHYVMRLILHQQLSLDYDNMYVYAPNAVKKTAGKGNYKKEQMIEAFIKCDSHEVMMNKLRSGLINDPDSFQSPKAKHYLKPLDDMIDAFWTMKTLFNEICK